VTGAELIAAERRRQIEVEGWTPEHDREHRPDELAQAAACYALPVPFRRLDLRGTSWQLLRHLWPWASDWWKPTPHNRVRELVKAGALIAAEIDYRLARGEVES
jgi:hypothetical protein